MNKQKPQLNRIGKPELGAHTSCDNRRAQQQEERFSFLPRAQPVRNCHNSANVKPQTLVTIALCSEGEELPAIQETKVQFLVREDPLEK